MVGTTQTLRYLLKTSLRETERRQAIPWRSPAVKGTAECLRGETAHYEAWPQPSSHTQVAEWASFQTSASLEGKINTGSLTGMMRVSRWMWEPRRLMTRWRSGCAGRDTERLGVQHGHLPALEVTWHKLKKGFSPSYRLFFNENTGTQTWTNWFCL